MHERPDRWFDRRYGAHGNLIERNTIVGEDTGIWVASRMGENTLPMDCSDPQYLPGVVLDHAQDNVVRDNLLENVGYGIRVEDDRNVVAGNQFAADDPPTGGPPAIPPPEPLPPCPIACAAAAEVARATLAVKRLRTPPGDETLAFRGRMTLPHPFAPPLDPLATGVGVVVADSAGGALLDVLVPGGARDRDPRIGWTVEAGGTRWRYVNRGAAPPGGITAIAIDDLSRRTPGLVQLEVKARRGAFPVDPAKLPLAGLLVVDPPTAETGQCGRATFAGTSGCTTNGRAVRCR